jgi:SAM-dependent methyltransferase
VTASPRQTGSTSGASWAADATALSWAEGDSLRDLLDLPRRLAVTVAAADLCEIRRITDVGSGPGEFLAVALERCPEAEGTWIDVSPAMEQLARTRLGGLAGRVQFTVTDLAHLGEAVPGGSADLIVSSRVTHHLGTVELAAFYRQAAIALRPGGWLANLDHVTIDDPWAGRLRDARTEFAPANRSTHRHDLPLPTAAQHLDALAAAGFTDLDVPWRAFWSVLILAKNPLPASGPVPEEGQTR